MANALVRVLNSAIEKHERSVAIARAGTRLTRNLIAGESRPSECQSERRGRRRRLDWKKR